MNILKFMKLLEEFSFLIFFLKLTSDTVIMYSLHCKKKYCWFNLKK